MYKDNYIIEPIKTKTTFNPLQWSKAFGKPLTKNIIEAKIIHSNLGLKLPLKTFAVTPQNQTIEFAGLQGYNERSKLLKLHLLELKESLRYARVMRLDVAIDFKGRIPIKVIKQLTKNRVAFQYKNTTYYKTPKEKKTNRVMDIKIYDKSLYAKLDYPLYRLEFVFKSGYLNKIKFKDIQDIYPKIEKTIKKYTNLTVTINDVFKI
jgi:hypothetical protein